MRFLTCFPFPCTSVLQLQEGSTELYRTAESGWRSEAPRGCGSASPDRPSLRQRAEQDKPSLRQQAEQDKTHLPPK